MKTALTPLLLKSVASAALITGLVFSSACTKSADTRSSTAATTSPSATDTTATTVPSTTSAASSTMSDATARASAVAAGDTWDNMKNYSYDQRNEFTQKVTDYSNRLDNSLSVAKGTSASRVTEARDELRTAASELSNATADTWDATKDRVGRAIQKADSAIRSAAE